MEDLIITFSNFGAMGVVAGVLFFQMNKLQTKLLEIVEKNTEAFQELKNIIEKCQIIHGHKEKE